VLRLVDANLDRLGEGLRVLEDISRFLLADPVLSKRLKTLRHTLVKDLGPLEQELLSARRVAEDVGAPAAKRAALQHQDLPALVAANSRRVQESLRVLEEFSRLSGRPLAGKAGIFENARFELYDLSSDVGETVDISAYEPARVDTLAAEREEREGLWMRVFCPEDSCLATGGTDLP